MTGTWHYNINGKDHGPVSFDGLVENVRSGKINPGVSITSDDSGETSAASTIPGLFTQSDIVPVATVEKWFCWIGSKEYGPVTTIQLEGWVREKRVSPDDFIRPGQTKEWFFAGLFKDLFEEAGIAGAADALIRQLHPELFAKNNKDGLREESPIDEFDHDGANQSMEEHAHPVAVQQEELVEKAPKRKVHNHKSLTEILLIVPRFMMDLAWAVADKIARIFPQTKTAWAILISSITAIFLLVFFLLPQFFEPHFENEECVTIYEEIITQMETLRAENASDEDWAEFKKTATDKLKIVIKNLKKTASVMDRPRQQILWAGNRNLLEILKNPKEPHPELRAKYKENLDYAEYLDGEYIRKGLK